MTTPNGAIVFNASTGDDNAASGLGPAIAQTGAGASTDGTAVVTGITTTGVSAGDLLWVQTASGRQFSIIASVDSGTQVTCDDTFVLGIGQTWAIGGKRATWDDSDSRSIFVDAQPAWDIVTETNQSLTSVLSMTADGSTSGNITLRGSDPSSLKQVIQTTNARGLQFDNASYITLRDLHIVTSTTNTNAAIASRGIYQVFHNLLVDDSGGSSWYRGFTRNGGNPSGHLSEFRIYNCTDDGFSDSGNGPIVGTFLNCVSANNGGDGISTDVECRFINCLVYGNGIYGIDSSTACFVSGCVIHGNTSDGVNVTGHSSVITNNIISSNGGYGINADAEWAFGSIEDRNAFYSNTSGALNNITSGTYDITLTADPFTDAASADFTINETSGGGADLRTTAVTLGSTETRPFRWLDTSTGGGATLASDARIERLK